MNKAEFLSDQDSNALDYVANIRSPRSPSHTDWAFCPILFAFAFLCALLPSVRPELNPILLPKARAFSFSQLYTVSNTLLGITLDRKEIETTSSLARENLHIP